MRRAAVGIYIRSGKATAVLLTVENGGPLVIERRRMLLADPSIPDSFQPYHVFETRSGPSAESTVEKLKKRDEEVAAHSVDEMLNDSRRLGYKPDRAVLVVGSKVDPQTLRNEHIRWHALEGRLFRTVVEKALVQRKVRCFVITSKEVFKTGATAFKIPEEELKRQVKELGRSLGSWRAEDKAAALAAWLGIVRRGIS